MNFFKSKTGIILVSILWGLGISSLFRKACTTRNCIVLKAPNPNDIVKKIYQNKNQCYTFIPQSSTCNSNPIKNKI